MGETQKKEKTRGKRRRTVNPGERERRFWHRVGLLVLIVLAIIAGVLAWFHFRPARASEEFAQQSPDLPLYVLVIGVDEEAAPRTNLVGLAAVNKEKKTIDFIMLPNNTKIEGRKGKGVQALQDIYTEGGMSLTRAVVEDIFHIRIPYYISFTPESFARMIDINDGLPLYVEKSMYGETNDGAVDFNLGQGYQLLTGREAAGYMSYEDKDGPLFQSLRQERFLKAFYEDRETHFGITNAVNAYRVWHDVDSNISAKDMARLVWTFRNVPVSDIHFYMLPGEIAKSGETKTATSDTLWNFDPVEVQKIIGTSSHAIANE